MMTNNHLSRRKFLGKSAVGFAGITIAPHLYAQGGVSPNDTLNLGFIGLGRRTNPLLNAFLSMDDVRVVAGSDVYGVKCKRFEKQVKDYYSEKKIKSDVKTYEHYHELVERSDIDAVVIVTPDHWHTLNAIDALKTGKDVYLEKPMTFTIKEGQALRLAVRDNNRILAVGSQQRSGNEFQHAVKLVQEGAIGRIQKINAHVGGPPSHYDLPQEEIPKDLNWDLWLGPNPYVHYNAQLNPPISLNPPQNEQFWGGWRWYWETGGGLTTDWGAHMFDIAQWGMGMDGKGPIEIIPAGYGNTPFLTFIYDNGVVMSEEPFNEQKTKGVKFWGNDGWIEVARGFYRASDPSLDLKEPENEVAHAHQRNFIDSIQSRKDPQVPVEIGHSSCTTCNLGNIAYQLGRPVRWDPYNERFIDDSEAQKHFHREYRDGYKLG